MPLVKTAQIEEFLISHTDTVEDPAFCLSITLSLMFASISNEWPGTTRMECLTVPVMLTMLAAGSGASKKAR